MPCFFHADLATEAAAAVRCGDRGLDGGTGGPAKNHFGAQAQAGGAGVLSLRLTSLE